MVRFDDGADDRKSHADALRFCREKRIEDVLEIAGRYTGAGVLILISALAPERFVVTLTSRSFASASDIASIALIIR